MKKIEVPSSLRLLGRENNTFIFKQQKRTEGHYGEDTVEISRPAKST